MGWTRKSYDAVHDWANTSKREAVRKIMLEDGLKKEVARLDAAKNLGEWYAITREAVEAIKAQQEIGGAARALRAIPSDRRAQQSRENGKKGGRPKNAK